MKQFFLPLIFAIFSVQAQCIRYDYEKELGQLFYHTHVLSITEKQKIINDAIRWIKVTLNNHLDGTKKLSDKDRHYLETISFMLSDICNEQGY